MRCMRFVRNVILAMAALSLVPVLASFAQVDPPRRSGEGTQRGQIHFGDIVVSGYSSAEMVLGQRIHATGRGTTVDTSDPKLGRKGRIQAYDITAYMVPKSNNVVDRIEAIGHVRFSGSGPAKPSGLQTVRATGTKGVYYKHKSLLDLDGPITFSFEQPTPDGKGKQTVDGKAEHAVYDEAKSHLTLTGDVEATVVTPQTPPEGSHLVDPEVEVDMSQSPYVVKLKGGPAANVQIRLKQTEPEKQEK